MILISDKVKLTLNKTVLNYIINICNRNFRNQLKIFISNNSSHHINKIKINNFTLQIESFIRIQILIIIQKNKMIMKKIIQISKILNRKVKIN